MNRIRIGIYGYGNLGRGVLGALKQNPDMELAAVFSRRAESGLKIEGSFARLESVKKIDEYSDKIDVLLVCAGSANDLPDLSPRLAEKFCMVDSFDTHARMQEHFENVDRAAKKGDKLALIACGWDPGLFSLLRLYSLAFLPKGTTNSFWGRGISQGHSEAIRRIPGVRDARQYTLPIDSAIERARKEGATISPTQGHRRECFVVAEENADKARIEREIKAMPNYFAGYETSVHFIDENELLSEHAGYPHGGLVIRQGEHEGGEKSLLELRLRLESNPDFTASVLIAFARAVNRLYKRGQRGAISVFDLAPRELLPLSHEEIIKNLL